ncbi:putative glycosyl transferase [Methylotuvimicrobium alcaliphilum 20Z]|uniref:Glycosyl transferase n=2 Tax=Methylotuvimicrobium alcaliphilum TaxID=271065 RepID=G4SYV5_META2|nr:putative glycosyl transferase [Methylotuvimicrobium alcaliphilum 20Z]
MNRQQLLSRLGKRGWPVIYSDGALNIWQRKSNRWLQATWFGAIEQTDNISLYHSCKILPRWEKYRLVDQLAIQKHSLSLKKAINLGSKDSSFISLAFHPFFWPYVETLNSDFVVFHIYDLFSKMHAWDSNIELMYQNLLNRADLITASSEAMVQDLSEKQLNKVKILHNGVDLDIFNNDIKYPCPDDLSEIPHPRIMNTGNIGRKIDLSLIVDIAKKRPEWHWVLVGNVMLNSLETDPYSQTALNESKNLSNIHFLGEKNRLEIPAYAQHSDINVICYRIRKDEWVSAVYPLKLNEYLAIGKPVISSPIETVINLFSSVVDIASTPQEWVNAIEKALNQGGVGTSCDRINISKQNSWDNRVDNLETWLFELLN